MASNWRIGDQIQNRWQIRHIRTGGMGIVYLVYDLQRLEPFAAKTFRDEIFARQPVTAERFAQEARAWIHLDAHPNVTQAHFVQTIEGKPYLFLEYVSGGSLNDEIKTPRLREDLPQVLRFALQVCDGMIHAAARGIRAHRDLKPRNCLLTPDRTLKITDFGLARASAAQRTDGTRGGTNEYMPPEQWDNFQQADQRSDIYSFGATLYAMLAGQPPFGKTAEVGVRELERRHKSDPPPPLSPKCAALSPIVEKCLAKQPADRFSDFAAVRNELASIYENLTHQPAPKPATGTELDAMQWSNKAASLHQLGFREEVITCCDRALARNSRYATAWMNKGTALLALDRAAESLACYERALEIEPAYAEAWSNKGVALLKSGQRDEALACYERALELNPHDAQAWTHRGVALMKLDRCDEALACYDRALAIAADFEPALTCKGNALSALGHHQQAIACYDRALEIDARSADAWFNKGAALVNGFQLYRKALKCFQRAHQLGLPQAAAAIARCEQSLAPSNKA